ncbi:hypothetical protein [Sagittula salina]|uniref:Fibronectin type-III domain-containing protein n=1 Tax=Sagittula salina TaxID=2820268 RepID=A0A940MRM6_9RHOB|nr:hypothetical protein [Sagittula salina]MBP0482787.1 hypothetical protein [Sagittula salina]
MIAKLIGFARVAVLALGVFGVAQSAAAEGIAETPLFGQRLHEMSAQFDGISIGNGRERSAIGEEQAFIFPSEAVSACVGSACTASGCIGSVCTGSGCGGSVCVGSGCGGSCGNDSLLETEQSLRLAMAEGDIVQGACPFNRSAEFGAVQVSGFNIEQSGGAVSISWIATGGPVEGYRVLVKTAEGVGVISEGNAKTGIVHTVSAPVLSADATYIVEIADSNGWITVLTSDGETTRHPVVSAPSSLATLEMAWLPQ